MRLQHHDLAQLLAGKPGQCQQLLRAAVVDGDDGAAPQHGAQSNAILHHRRPLDGVTFRGFTVQGSRALPPLPFLPPNARGSMRSSTVRDPSLRD